MRPLEGGGYAVTARTGRSPLPFLRRTRTLTAKSVVFSGGVLGTVELLLKLKESPDGLPKISDRLGDFVRTNSEVLMGVVTERRDVDLSRGHRDRLDPADGRALAPRARALSRGLRLLPPARDAARAGRHRGHAPPERRARCS